MNSTLGSQVQNPTSIARRSTAHYQASTMEQSDRSRRYTQHGSLALFGQDLDDFDKHFEYLLQISTLSRPLENGHGHTDSQTSEGPEKSKKPSANLTDQIHGEGTQNSSPDRSQENTVPVDQTGIICLSYTAN